MERLSPEQIRQGARYLSLSLDVFVNPEDYAASVLHAVSDTSSSDAAAGLDETGLRPEGKASRR
jgi:hypothetical protein